MFKSFPWTVLVVWLCTLTAQAREPADWLRVQSLPGVRLALEHGVDGPEGARLRVGEQEQAFRVAKLPAGTVLYHWGEAETFQRWSRAGGLDQKTLDAVMEEGDYPVRGLYMSLHPWDSANYGHDLLTIQLQEPLQVLVATEGGNDDSEAWLDAATHGARAVSAGAWPELLRLGGLGGVYFGSAAPGGGAAGFRWVAVHDAAILKGAHVASAGDMLGYLRGAPWWQLSAPTVPEAVGQFFAVARTEAHGASESAIRSAAPARAFAWFWAALAGQGPRNAAERDRLWNAAPPVAEAWRAWGVDARQAICGLSYDASVVDLSETGLCREFVRRMCVMDDLFGLGG